VILANNTDGQKAYVLPHDAYCAALGHCACWPPFGEPHSRPVVLKFVEGEWRVVPRAVLSVPEIAQAIRRGRLRVTGEGP